LCAGSPSIKMSNTIALRRPDRPQVKVIGNGIMPTSNQQVEFLYLSQEDVIAAGGLDMAETLKVVEASFRLHGQGKTILPPKPVLRWGGPETEETTGRIMAMPAYLGGDMRIAGIKWIPSAPQNPKKYGLPRANAIIVLNDPDTLMPLAVMDGTIVSAMRTGAATGVAAKYLARPQSRRIGLVGAGVQGRTQLMALKAALPAMAEVRVFDLDHAKTAKFAEEMSEQLGLKVQAVDSAEAACKGTDVFVTATMSTFAYVQADWYAPGILHSEVSFWDTPAEALGHLDRIVADDYYQVEHHGVDVCYRAVRDGYITRDKVTDLGDIVAGKVPGRQSETEKIMFNPIGMGINDVSEAYRVYRNAMERGIGQRLKLWDSPHWV
jgi:2,3-diaminopropionate biosynthesis protein SbnB